MQLSEFELEIFGIGLGVGLIVAAIVGLNGLRLRWGLRKELGELKNSLYLNMNVQSQGTEKLKKSLEDAQQANEKLRTTVAMLSNKPGRAEIQTLHLWERAIELLTVRSPNFAAAWQVAIAEAKSEMADTRTGLKAMMRKTFLPSSIEIEDKGNSDNV